MSANHSRTNRFTGFAMRFLALMAFGMQAFAGEPDPGPGVVSFSPATATVTESVASVTLTVSRTQGTQGAVSVSYNTVEGSATATGDFTATSGTLSWSNGDASDRFITVPLAQNTSPSGTRYFDVVLSAATGGVTIAIQNAAPGRAIVRITDYGPDTFPVGNTLPEGFSGYSNNPGAWVVATGQGYQSLSSLGSPPTLKRLELVCVPDYTTGDDICEYTPVAGVSTLSFDGPFRDGVVNFRYRVASGAGATLLVYVDNDLKLMAPASADWYWTTISISAGSHRIRWTLINSSDVICNNSMARDADGAPCEDRLYIDNVEMPSLAKPLYVVIRGVGTIDVGGQSPCVSTSPMPSGNLCTYYLTPNQQLTLAASPAFGSFFEGWSGAGCSGSSPCTLTMSDRKEITATFPPLAPTLTVSTQGGGSGIVTSTPAGISCPGDCTETFANGTMVTLTATPSPGSIFIGWSSPDYYYASQFECHETVTCTLDMRTAKRVTARFIPDVHTLTVELLGMGSGTVTSMPAGISCPGTCSAIFPHGSNVVLTITPGPTSHGSYTGNYICNSAAPVCNVMLNPAMGETVVGFEFLPGRRPDPPVLNSITPGLGTLKLNFAAPANDGGLPITGYYGGCGIGNVPGHSTRANSPPEMIMPNMTPGATFTCSVIAQNAAGISEPSNLLTGVPLEPLVLMKVFSRKQHAGAGVFDLEMRGFSAANTPVEPRSGSNGHVLVFEFNHDVDGVGGVSTSLGNASVTIANQRAFVALNGIPDNRRVSITLNDVMYLGLPTSFSATLGFLVGDVTNSWFVTAADIAGIKANAGPVNANNFRYDLDLSGFVEVTDTRMAKGRSGVKLVPN